MEFVQAWKIWGFVAQQDQGGMSRHAKFGDLPPSRYQTLGFDAHLGSVVIRVWEILGPPVCRDGNRASVGDSRFLDPIRWRASV
jgi:hypothetical protein